MKTKKIKTSKKTRKTLTKAELKPLPRSAKEAKAAGSPHYYQINAEALIEQKRQFRQENDEALDEKAKKYYQINAEAFKAAK